nr:AAA domain protein [uncultured bacterium]
MERDNFIVITGGPGSGKTTLIDALAALGHGRTVEAGRAIIQAQVAIGGNGLHWGDKGLFAELMLMHEVRSYEEAKGRPGLVFFDRSVAELTGYLTMIGLPMRPHFARAAEVYRYHRLVFVTPPWREIFTNDVERKQDFAEAVANFEFCVTTYRGHGYETVELPKVPVAERVAFVLDRVSR